MYANLMVDYFNFLGKSDSQAYQVLEPRIDLFCNQYSLQSKAIKEIHYLCIQLQKMTKEVITD